MIVLDCSIAVAWCFADEASAVTDALLDLVQAEGAIVPSLWTLEVANVLIQAARRNRLPSDGVRGRLELLDMLPITVDEAGVGPVWRGHVLNLAREDGLTIYDATYLELAIRRGLVLATSDRALRDAARRHGVMLIPG